MLVFFVNHSVAPVNLGGAERSMIQLVEEWHESDPDFEAHFITKAPRGQFIASIEERGWSYTALRYRGWAGESIPSLREGEYAHADYAATLQIIDLMRRRRPDLVVTNTVVAPWGAFAAKALGVPHAWFVREYGDLDHGLTFQTGRENTFADIGLMSEAVFTNSLALKAHIGQYLDESKVTVVYPSVDADYLNERASEPLPFDPFPGASEDDMRIVIVGRLSETKGQWRVIDALATLNAHGTPTRLCLVGSAAAPGYDAKLQDRARRLGVLDRVVFAGELANPFPVVAAGDVGVTPSGVEAFGRTTLEYMTLGKAVVAGAAGGSGELVDDGVTGFHFDPEREESLVQALARIGKSTELRRQMGEAGRARARSFTTSDYSNAAAIARLIATAATETPYRLPHVAEAWFALARTPAVPGEQPSWLRRHARRVAAAVRSPRTAFRTVFRR